MDQGLLHLHNIMRWVVLIFAIIVIIRGLSGMSGGKTFSNSDKRMALFLMIGADIQLLLGLALYFMKGWNKVLAGGGAMANKALRFWSVEHITGMLIAIILIHIGYSAVKKNISDTTRFKRMFWYTLIALIIILATIPWPFRELVGRPLFPGM